MSFSAKILSDCIAVTSGVRLTTFELVFSRFILAELNTHRMLSRNSASSRAIPTEKQIARVLEHPFVPLTFNTRVRGMGVGDALVGTEADAAEEIWLNARDMAVGAAEGLMAKNCDKSRVNRLLEPFMWHTAIVSATEWDNFFALRNHPAAQPEFRLLAGMMQEAHEASTPVFIEEGEWACPLALDYEINAARNSGDWDRVKKISASRCARVSYDKHTDKETREATLERAERLLGSVPPHLSPFEHVARPFTEDEQQAAHSARASYQDFCLQHRLEYDPVYADSFYFKANFRGWVQMRWEIPNQARADWAIKDAARQ